jgi:hypothetical protein
MNTRKLIHIHTHTYARTQAHTYAYIQTHMQEWRDGEMETVLSHSMMPEPEFVDMLSYVCTKTEKTVYLHVWMTEKVVGNSRLHCCITHWHDARAPLARDSRTSPWIQKAIIGASCKACSECLWRTTDVIAHIAGHKRLIVSACGWIQDQSWCSEHC